LEGETALNLLIRNEISNDYFEVENLTRKAFWNVYKPGCDEHLLIHNMRSLPCYIRRLDFIAEADGKIVGSIFYSKAKLTVPDGTVKEFISAGPLSVHPDYQKKGIGSALIRHSLKIAWKMGYTAVFITGNPVYYGRFGFKTASDFGVHLKGVPLQDKAGFFMVKLLDEHALDGIAGTFEFDACYEVDKTLLEDFEANFPPKKKEKRPGQLSE
jgi:hypothetical protein